VKLLARWGIPADAAVALTEHGTNNRTLQVTAGDRRWSLRISQNLTPPQVRAEHRLTGAELAALAGTLRWRTAEGGELGHIVADAGTSPPALERSCPISPAKPGPCDAPAGVPVDTPVPGPGQRPHDIEPRDGTAATQVSNCPLPWPAGYAGYLHWSR
jgi:hypothetical protein